MIRAAADAGKPVLGICRGCQLLNVFFGGTLTQEVSHTDVHQIELVPGKPVTVLKRHDARNVPSRRAAELCGVKCVINSGHHQGICRLGRELQIEQLWFPEDLSARERREIMDEARASGRVSADAGEKYIIEMYSHKSLPIIGVQWHPEMLAEYPDEPAVDGTAFLRNVLDRTCGAQR